MINSRAMLSFLFVAGCIASCYAAPTNWTTSGLSSGGFFTVQMGVAYSSECTGIGVVAGGPYYCAQDSETTALTACMSAPLELNVKKLETDTANFAKEGDIDDPSNIAKQRVYLFSGKKDITVQSGVVSDAEPYFKSFGASVMCLSMPISLCDVCTECLYMFPSRPTWILRKTARMEW